MPTCPRCGYANAAASNRCPRCAAPLDGAAGPSTLEPDGEVVVKTLPSRPIAEMCAELLRAEGVPCVLVPRGPGAGAWGSSEWMPHELRVRRRDLERARELLAEETDDEPAPEDQDPT